MTSLVEITAQNLWFFCPGCQCSHCLNLDASRDGPRWTWDGNLEAPTVTPSVKCLAAGEVICHLWIKAGRIEFLGDCEHDLAGQVVNMTEV